MTRKDHQEGGHAPGSVSFDMRERMFDCYMDNDCSQTEVSRQFGISCTTVHKISKREHWDERAARIKGQIQKKVDAAIAQRESQHIKIAKNILAQEVKSYIAQMTAGRAVGSVSNILAIMKYIDERAGIVPGESPAGIGALNLNITIGNNDAGEPISQREENFQRNLRAIFLRGGALPSDN